MDTLLYAPVKEKKVISDGIIGMIVLLFTETMFFAGLVSAYIVNRANAITWQPLGQPLLPVGITAVNTLILLVSAIAIFLFIRKYKSGKKSRSLLITAMILGITFLSIQGTEWAKLFYFGFTSTSSLYGAFFYTIIGAHAFHAVAGLTILLYLFFALKNPHSFSVAKNKIVICSMYWYFVVAVWPVLYVLVFLI